MEGSSKDSGTEATTRSAKRQRDKEEDTVKRQKRLESEFLRVKNVVGPRDMVVDAALPKLKVSAEPEDVKVKVESIDVEEFVTVEKEVMDDNSGRMFNAAEEPVLVPGSAGVSATATRRGQGRTNILEGLIRFIVDEVRNLSEEENCESFRARMREILAPVLSLEAVHPPEWEVENGNARSEEDNGEAGQVLACHGLVGDVVQHSETEPVREDNAAGQTNQESKGKDIEEERVNQVTPSMMIPATGTPQSPQSAAHRLEPTGPRKIVSEVVKSWDPVTKHLHIDVLSFNGSEKEKRALNRFTDVIQLEVDMIQNTKAPEGKIVMPDFFKTVKVLKVREVHRGLIGKVTKALMENFVTACLRDCKNLESITLPRFVGTRQIDGVFNILSKHVSSANSCLQEIDLELITVTVMLGADVTSSFQTLFTACAERGVQICNPTTSWTVKVYDSPSQLLLGRCIKSLKMNRSDCSDYLLLNLERMESLTVTGVSGWMRYLHYELMKYKLNGKKCPEKWTRLSKLDATLGKESSVFGIAGTILELTCQFLVEQSPNLKELRVENNPRDGAAFLLAPNLLSRRSLRKLTLCDLSGDCGFLEKTWEALPSLEELTLDGCSKWEIWKEKWYASENSTFLELKNLRRLWLKSLCGILDTHDQFLRNVLSKMQLTHLKITTEKSIPQVDLIPRAGIACLMKGPCGQSIQELSIDGWSLQDMFPGNGENGA